MLSTKDIVLLLLSSVLVSEEPQHRNEERQNSKEEEGADRFGEAVMISGDTKGGASHPQFTKQLDTKWTFWYESNPRHDKGKPVNKTDYLKDVKRGKTFDTIASFWDCWREVQTVCNPSEACNYELFKHGVKPVWEDPKNSKGGKCVLSMPCTATLEDTMKQWVSLMITLLIGEFGPDINGVVLSRRSWGNIFSVWVRNANDKDTVDATMRHLHELFGRDVQIRFQRHQTSIRKKVATTTKPLQLGTQLPSSTLEKRRLSESEGSSSEGERRERNKGKEEPRRNSMVMEVRPDNHEAFGRQLQPPVNKVKEDKVATRDASGGVRESNLFDAYGERVPSNYVSLKRKASVSTSQNKPVVKRELPTLAELSAQELGIGLAIIVAAVATSILSWTFS